MNRQYTAGLLRAGVTNENDSAPRAEMRARPTFADVQQATSSRSAEIKGGRPEFWKRREELTRIALAPASIGGPVKAE